MPSFCSRTIDSTLFRRSLRQMVAAEAVAVVDHVVDRADPFSHRGWAERGQGGSGIGGQRCQLTPRVLGVEPRRHDLANRQRHL
jgi:hypothetical protein